MFHLNRYLAINHADFNVASTINLRLNFLTTMWKQTILNYTKILSWNHAAKNGVILQW